jgi:dienelactone hydrolase
VIARRSVWITMAAALLFGAGGCSSGQHTIHAQVRATPARALFDTPVAIRVSGLPAGERTTISATSTTSDGTTWTDSAVFVADHTGVAATGQAPVSGSYRGVDPMGVIEDEAPGGNADTPGRFAPRHPWVITIAVRTGGHQVAHTTVTRLRPSDLGVASTDVRPGSGGVYGEFFAPPHAAGQRRPAVLVFGGSEGGLSNPVVEQAALLAARGYPALAVAYFHEPGLPATLTDIPIEYFAGALRRLAGEPGVDPNRLAVEGDSRGSEAALLTAAHYPTLVHGVIADSPSDIAWGGMPGAAAWTWNGKPVPTAPHMFWGQVDPPGQARADIDVAAINGPVLAICGKQDDLWPSCGYATSMAARIKAAHSRYPTTVLAYAGAGHFVGTLTPYVPATATQGRTATGAITIAGGLPSADEYGRAQAWPRVLGFLAHLPKH